MRWLSSIGILSALALVLAACSPAPASSPASGPATSPTSAPASPVPPATGAPAAQATAPAASGTAAVSAAPGPTFTAKEGVVSADQFKGTRAKRPYRLAFVTKNWVNPVWLEFKRGSDDAARELGATIESFAPNKPDNLEEEIKIMEDLIAKKVDGIVFTAVDTKGVVPVVLKANDAGIPIMNYNTIPAGGTVIAFAGISEYDLMKTMAEYVVKDLGGKGNVIVLEGVPGAQTAIDRNRAIQDVFGANPGMKVLASQTANYQRAQGMQVTENLLQRFPNADAILAANDEMALGAVEAAAAAGRSNLKIYGFNGQVDALKAIKQGAMVATIDIQPYLQGYAATAALITHLNGDPVPQKILAPGVVVDRNNVDQFLKE